jgi:hypothetical protein
MAAQYQFSHFYQDILGQPSIHCYVEAVENLPCQDSWDLQLPLSVPNLNKNPEAKAMDLAGC